MHATDLAILGAFFVSMLAADPVFSGVGTWALVLFVPCLLAPARAATGRP